MQKIARMIKDHLQDIINAIILKRTNAIAESVASRVQGCSVQPLTLRLLTPFALRVTVTRAARRTRDRRCTRPVVRLVILSLSKDGAR